MRPIFTARRAIAALLGLLLMAGCLGRDPGLRFPTNVVPRLEQVEVWRGHDQTRLLVRQWRPDQAARAAVIVVHGLKDHAARYGLLVERLRAAGVAVHAFDLRGHGGSAGPRQWVRSFDQYVADLEAFVRRVRKIEGGRPLFVLGHSMGGAIVALWATEGRPDAAGIILSAPALALDALPSKVAAALAGGAWPIGRLHAAGLDEADFARDPSVRAAMAADPLISHQALPGRTAAELVRGMTRVWAGAATMKLPVLIVHGSADRVTAPAGSRDYLRAVGARDQTLRLYPGAWHDLMHDPAGEAVAADVVRWVTSRVDGERAPEGSPLPPHLPGDRVGTVSALELAARATFAGEVAARRYDGTLRLRLAVPGRVGWVGGLDAAIGREQVVSAQVLGLSVRHRSWWLSVGGGIGAGSLRGWTTAIVPAEVALDGGVGPVRLLLRGRYEYSTGAAGSGAPGDLRQLSLGLRLGADRRVFRQTWAGQGPILAVSVGELDAVRLVGVSLGLALWGGD
ncbi:MAG: lysophospholipase [Kofleriaceae bacterium]|nr:lysophospholipase [Kofleriaceae bacterium]